MLDLSNAFATLANGGVHHDPTAVARVEFPDGEVDEPENPEGTRVVSDGVAYKVVDVMTGTLDYGTASCCDIACPAAGKTGTTEEQADAWFVGYTPQRLDRGLGRQPGLARAAARLRRRPRGADLARLHDGGRDRALRRLPRAGEPAELSSYYSEHTASRTTSSDDTTTTDAYGTTTTTRRPTPDAATTGRTATDYDPDLYAPGAGQESGRRRPAGHRRRREPGGRRRDAELSSAAAACSGEFELIAAIRERAAAGGGAGALAGARPRQRRRRGGHRPRRRDARPRVDALVEGVHFRIPPFEPAARRSQGAGGGALGPGRDGAPPGEAYVAARRSRVGARRAPSCSSSPTASRPVAAEHGSRSPAATSPAPRR